MWLYRMLASHAGIGSCQGFYLSRSCDTKCSQQCIAALASRCAKHTFNKPHCASRLEDISLSRILLEDSCKGESLDCSLSCVFGGRFDGDVGGRCGQCLFDIEEALAVCLAWPQTEEDVEQGRGGLIVLHLGWAWMSMSTSMCRVE